MGGGQVQYYRRALSGGENKIFIMKPGSRPPREAQFPAHFPISLDIKWCTKNIWGEKKEKDMKWWMCRVFLCVTFAQCLSFRGTHGASFYTRLLFWFMYMQQSRMRNGWLRGNMKQRLWWFDKYALSQSHHCSHCSETAEPITVMHFYTKDISTIPYVIHHQHSVDKSLDLIFKQLDHKHTLRCLQLDWCNSYYYPKMFSFHGSKSNTILRIFLLILAKFNIKKSIFSDRNLWNDATIHANYSVLKTSHYV